MMNLNPFRKKDYTPGSDDYKHMLASNDARNEESGVNNSSWSPGALKRLQRKERWEGIKSHWKLWWRN